MNFYFVVKITTLCSTNFSSIVFRMDLTFLLIGFIFGAAVAGVIAYISVDELRKDLKRTQKEFSRLRSEIQDAETCGKGIELFTERLNSKKEASKSQIITALKMKKKISNVQIVELLDVSSATAVRYMDELEKEGKIKQVGTTGRGVFYTLNTSIEV